MTAGGAGRRSIPAGYTYLGQFIDHDLTFDRTTVAARARRLPGGAAAGPLAGARPRLALRRRAANPARRSSTSRRPAAEDGHDEAVGGDARPRRASTCRAGPADRGEATAIDPRLRATTRTSPSRRPTWRSSASTTGSSTAARLRAGRPALHPGPRAVVKHYQWMIRHDYLPRICDQGGGRRRLHQRPQGLRGRRDADRRADDADRVLGRRASGSGTA